MNILYWSSHSVLEYDELKLLTSLGHNVFSLGAYLHNNKGTNLRGEIPELYDNDYLRGVAIQSGQFNVHPELIEWADVLIFMHGAKMPNDKVEQPVLASNWPNIKHKRVIWRSIGQSVSVTEKELQKYKNEGLQIVRYSPMERNIPGYAGEDAIIRFYKDPGEFKDWNGKNKMVLNFTQSMTKRGDHCGYKLFMESTDGYDRRVYGPGNEDMPGVGGDAVNPIEQKKLYRDSRVYWYHGTAPASYVLTLIEAMMTGMPVVAAGTHFTKNMYGMDTNEIESIIDSGQNGFIAQAPVDFKNAIDNMFNDELGAKKISENARKTAINLFGVEKIRQQWQEFLS